MNTYRLENEGQDALFNKSTNGPTYKEVLRWWQPNRVTLLLVTEVAYATSAEAQLSKENSYHAGVGSPSTVGCKFPTAPPITQHQAPCGAPVAADGASATPSGAHAGSAPASANAGAGTNDVGTGNGAAAAKPKTGAELVADQAKAAASPINGDLKYCTSKPDHVIFQSDSPVPVAMKVKVIYKTVDEKVDTHIGELPLHSWDRDKLKAETKRKANEPT